MNDWFTSMARVALTACATEQRRMGRPRTSICGLPRGLPENPRRLAPHAPAGAVSTSVAIMNLRRPPHEFAG